MVKVSTLAGLAAGAVLFSLPVIAAATAPVRNSWPPETLNGKIMMVNPAGKLVVVRADGVPFDLVVKPSTRIDQGKQKINLQMLAQDVNRPVSIRFVPERSGDVARSIEVNP
jgi:hypothetical protein